MPSASSTDTEVTGAVFNERVLNASRERPVLVDFWAPWCGPCKALAPALTQLQSAYAERLAIVKLNVDDEPDTAATYQIRALPTLVLFRNGQEAARWVGLQSADALRTAIDQTLAAGSKA